MFRAETETSISLSEGRDRRLITNWIMLGSGAVARECFLPSFEQLGWLDRLTVVDVDVPADLRDRWSAAKFVQNDFRKALKTSKLEGVTAAVVTLPNRFHKDAVVKLLESGAHVLCEKPLALTEEDCRDIRDAAASAGRLLSVNMVRRLYPSIEAIAGMIGTGQLGEIRRVTIEHGGAFRWPARSFAPFDPANGGVFADMGVHYLDMAEYFAGPVRLVSYTDDWRGGVEADASAELESLSGAEIRIRVSRVRELANSISVEGTEATATARVDSFEKFHLSRAGMSQALEIRPFDPQSPAAQATFQGCFARQLERFRSRVESGNWELDEADTAVRSARTIEEAYGGRSRRSPAGRARDTAVVTGATGFIGTRLVERLFEEGSPDVTAIVRRPQTCAAIGRFPVKLADVDLLDAGAVRKAVEGSRQVFHLAYGRDGANAEAITIQGTKNIVEAAIEAKCESVVVLSTINVIGWPDGEVDESAPYRPAGGAYGSSKATMERWCLERAKDAGKTRVVLLLPSCVYGPGGKTFTELPAQLARKNEFGWISEGAGNANYVFIDNLIDAIFLAASLPEAHGRRFIVNDGWTSWRNFLEPIVSPWKDEIRSYEPGELGRLMRQSRRGALKRAIRAAGASPQFRHEIKQTPIGTIARALVPRNARMAQAAGVNGTHPAAAAASTTLPPDWIEDLFGNHKTRFSSGQARAVLGWTPRISLEEGQRISVEHLCAMGLRPK